MAFAVFAITTLAGFFFSVLTEFRLRRSAPAMPRPFRAPLYPLFPAVALGAAVVCLLTMVYYNHLIATLFVALGVLGYGYFATTAKRRALVVPA